MPSPARSRPPPAAKQRPMSQPAAWPEGARPLHVALLDLGCKNNIVRCLQKRGCRVTVLPGTATAAELAALAPDGLMLSNGPGDPAEKRRNHQKHRRDAGHRHPRLRHLPGPPAHRRWRPGQDQQDEVRPPRRQPARDDFATGRTFITSQNHGYAVLGATLPPRCGPGQPCQRQRQDLRRHRLPAVETASPCSSIPKPAAARGIPSSCSTASCRTSAASTA